MLPLPTSRPQNPILLHWVSLMDPNVQVEARVPSVANRESQELSAVLSYAEC